MSDTMGDVPKPRLKPLSKREQEVAMLLKAGHRSNKIAKLLAMNEKTVGTYVSRIYTKCNIDRSKNLYYLINKVVELEILKQ